MDPLRSAAGPGKATENPCLVLPFTFPYPLPRKKFPGKKYLPRFTEKASVRIEVRRPCTTIVYFCIILGILNHIEIH
jgi:hypothetical protein